jgi:hypothetical protein
VFSPVNASYTATVTFCKEYFPKTRELLNEYQDFRIFRPSRGKSRQESYRKLQTMELKEYGMNGGSLRSLSTASKQQKFDFKPKTQFSCGKLGKIWLKEPPFGYGTFSTESLVLNCEIRGRITYSSLSLRYFRILHRILQTDASKTPTICIRRL